MLRLRFQKIGSLLGLLAILMTALAPTVSQALTAPSRVDALLTHHCSEHSPSANDPDSRSSHDAFSHLHACGYCNLSTHAPALPSPTVTFALTIRAIHHREATRFESLRRAQPLTAAKPRAPPPSA